MGWITLRTVHVSLCFHSQCIGMPGQATSDFQLMKAVAKETRLWGFKESDMTEQLSTQHNYQVYINKK